MGLFTTTDSSTILSEMLKIVQDGCNTSLQPGDERRIYTEALAPVIVALYNVIDDVAKQKMLKYARGEVLDAIGGDAVPRLSAKHATTQLKFYLNDGYESDITIPKGTRVSTIDDYYFATDNECCIKQGQLSATTSATAVAGGSDYNEFISGTVCIIVDQLPGVDGCKNVTVTSGGDDGEPYDSEGDDRYRERIHIHDTAVSTAGSIDSYKYHALSADSTIADVAVDNAENVGEEYYDVILTIICQNGAEPSADVINKVMAACNSEYVRPLCDHIMVQGAEQVAYDIDLVYYVTEEEESAAVENIEGTGGAIDKFVTEQDISIAKPINPDRLRYFMQSPVDDAGNILAGAKRIVITSPTYLELAYNQVGKFSGNINISHKTTE